MPFSTGDPLTYMEPDAFFDLTLRGLRSATYRFTLIENISGYALGEIHPISNSAPTLSHDTTRAVKRTLTLTLGVADTATFDEIAHRVDVDMVLGDGRVFPLGRYMPVSFSRVPTTAGDMSSVALADEMFVLSQPIEASFSAALVPGNDFNDDGVGRTNVYEVVNTFLDRYLLFNPESVKGGFTSGSTGTTAVATRRGVIRDIEYTNYVSSGSWQLGANGTTVLNDLAVNGDYFTPWMGNDRHFHMKRVFDPESGGADLDFDAQECVIRDSITRTNDLLEAPNRIIVVSNAGNADNRTAPIVGSYDVPPGAPHSVANRGFVISEVIDLQISSRAQANAIARSIAVNQKSVERVELSTVPDPRHDSYNVVRWGGELWLETGWSLPLMEGSAMRHTMQRIYV